MGVTKQTLVPGDGQNYPALGNKVSIHYVGALHDPSAQYGLGKVYVLTSFSVSILLTPVLGDTWLIRYSFDTSAERGE